MLSRYLFVTVRPLGRSAPMLSKPPEVSVLAGTIGKVAPPAVSSPCNDCGATGCGRRRIGAPPVFIPPCSREEPPRRVVPADPLKTRCCIGCCSVRGTSVNAPAAAILFVDWEERFDRSDKLSSTSRMLASARARIAARRADALDVSFERAVLADGTNSSVRPTPLAGSAKSARAPAFGESKERALEGAGV